MRNLAAALVVGCVVAGCAQGGISPSSTALPPSPAATSSTARPASTTSTATTNPPAITTTTGMVSPGCTETLPELPGPGESLIFAVCDFETSLPYPLVRHPLPGLSGVESALTLLVRGTTAAEQEYGLMVGFDWVESSDADRITVGAAIDEAGVLDLEFALDGEPWHPGTLAGTSSQAFSFVDPLYATVFQFPEVTGIGPGSLCWGELDCTQIFTREMWESMVGENTQRDVGPGCGMQRAWFDPACGASLPLCGDGIEIVPGAEGATGAAVYYLEITSPEPCFLNLDGTVTVLSRDGTAAQVDGSPQTVDMSGVVTDRFAALDGSMPVWVMRNWCEEDGTVRIEVNGTRYDKPAGGRCDAPEASATLGTP